MLYFILVVTLCWQDQCQEMQVTNLPPLTLDVCVTIGLEMVEENQESVWHCSPITTPMEGYVHKQVKEQMLLIPANL